MAGKDAIANLLEIMRDTTATPRDRLNAAVSASRVEKLQMPGEAPPESMQCLRGIIDDGSVATNLRREAAAACAYFERRSKKAAIAFNVADLDEKRRQWRKLVNGGIRVHLGKIGRWPADKRMPFSAVDEFELPACDPDLALSALRKAIDERVPGTWSGSEAERRELLLPLARIIHQRLAQFGLAK
jgi:hypothetical protein